MRGTALLALLVVRCANAQDAKPACLPGAICFAGRVSGGEKFRKAINADLEFLLEPGWKIAIAPRLPDGNCREFAAVVNPPYRQHNALYIDMSYGWTAEQEIGVSPREFGFVTNCADYRTEAGRLDFVLWPYTAKSEREADEAMAKLGTSAQGQGRMWITGSKISHTDDTPENKAGRIEWMTFSVEIRLPRRVSPANR
jgi:hypothetical protein